MKVQVRKKPRALLEQELALERPDHVDPAAVALGRLGGSVKSAAKTAAAKRNIEKRWAKHNQKKGTKHD